MEHSYNGRLVALSVAIAILASFTALDLAARVQAAAGRTRALWIAGGATAMGIGIWSMHFVGMLAFDAAMPVRYNPALVVLSVAVAIGTSAFALWTASRDGVGMARMGLAAVAMGAAIAGMHYIGMASMDMNATLTYNWPIWWASIAIAVTASFVALVLFRRLGQDELRLTRLLRIGAAVAMGFAIAGMHYTGMAAARFTPLDTGVMEHVNGLPPVAFGLAVTVNFLLVVGLALMAAMLDRILHARSLEADLRTAMVAAERTNRAKSEFLSNMSHELRTPLNSVIGFANIVLKNKNKTLGPQDIAYLDRIAANGRHLLGLINGILDLSKIEAGRLELELSPVNVGTLVRDTVFEMASQTDGRPVTLTASVAADLEPIETDGSKLKQVLINLIGNALKFTKEGSVTVRVTRDDFTGKPVSIDVIDTGIGIPAHRLEAVFEAFQQADSSTSRQYGGTGLGLTITRSLALLMGFDVRVTSEVRVGSMFSIVISPWENAQRPAAAPKQAEVTVVPAIVRIEAPTRPVLALIIDDDPDAREMQSMHLRELGCDVATAASADEGIATARRLLPDLITLDVMMPRKSGMEALHEFKTDPALRDIPIVIVSVVAEEHRGRVLGAAECLDKPVTSEMFAAVLLRNVDLVSDLGGLVARVRNQPRATNRHVATNQLAATSTRRTAVVGAA